MIFLGCSVYTETKSHPQSKNSRIFSQHIYIKFNLNRKAMLINISTVTSDEEPHHLIPFVLYYGLTYQSISECDHF